MTTLIVGGNSGIGEAVYQMDRSRGFPLREEGTWLRPSIFELDVADPTSIQHFIEQHGESIDRLVYSAGFNSPDMLREVSSDDVSDTFDVNVIGFINILSFLADQRFGELSVVAIVSDAATVPMRGSIAYCSSKAALSMAVRCAAREMAGMGWRVNGVAPGVVANTPMTEKIDRIIPEMRGWTKLDARKYENSLIPMKRRCTKEEVAQLVLQVLEGPAYLNGAIIPITGGK